MPERGWSPGASRASTMASKTGSIAVSVSSGARRGEDEGVLPVGQRRDRFALRLRRRREPLLGERRAEFAPEVGEGVHARQFRHYVIVGCWALSRLRSSLHEVRV